MSNHLLMEQCEYEWEVVRGDSVFTPVISIGYLTNTKFRFEIRIISELIEILNSTVENFEIYGHVSNLDAGVKLNICVWLYYSCNNMEILHFQKEIGPGSPACTHFGTKALDGFTSYYDQGNARWRRSDHLLRMKMSKSPMILKSKFHTSGHLGTISSNNQILNSSQNLSEYFSNYCSISELQLQNDVKVIIEDKHLSTSKMSLTAHSQVFKKMREHDFLESKTNTITITDCSYELFDIFLKYLHTGKIPDGFEGNIEELYAVADKYDVRSLRKECVRIMALDINLDNVCKVLLLADECSNDVIKTQSKSFVVENFSSLENTAEWEELVQARPAMCCDILATVHSLCHFP